MEPTPAELTHTAIAQVTALNDPEQRARNITEILKAVEDASLRDLRQQDLRALRDQPQPPTFKEIGEKVGLTTGRVEQIVKGRITGRRRPQP